MNSSRKSNRPSEIYKIKWRFDNALRNGETIQVHTARKNKLKLKLLTMMEKPDTQKYADYKIVNLETELSKLTHSKMPVISQQSFDKPHLKNPFLEIVTKHF